MSQFSASRLILTVAALLFTAGGALAQTPYRVVTPDGKVLYTDRPPVSSKARISEVQPPPPRPASASVPAQRPTLPLAGPVGGPPISQQPPIPPEVMMPATVDSRTEHRECMRKNAAATSLIAAAREVIRTRGNLERSRAQGRNLAYAESEYERSWRHYKASGGPAAAPEAVTVPEDPCEASMEKVRQQAQAAQAEYQACIAAHPREMRLMSLANEVILARNALAMVERMREEKRRNPAMAKDGGPAGEWRMLERVDPVAARAQLDRQFVQYRDSGGPAAKVEDVQPVPNPCLGARAEARAPESSPLKRQAIMLPGTK